MRLGTLQTAPQGNPDGRLGSSLARSYGPIFCLTILFLLSGPSIALAQTQNTELDCRSIDPKNLLERVETKASTGRPETWVQPDRDTSDIIFDGAPPTVDDLEACAAIFWKDPGENAESTGDCFPNDKSKESNWLRVVSTTASKTKTDEDITIVRIPIPKVDEWLGWCDARIVVGIFDKKGDSFEDWELLAGFNRKEWISHKWNAIFVAGVGFLVFYIGTAVAAANARHKKAEKEAQRKNEAPPPRSSILKFSPVRITAGQGGLASASTLQIFGFSLLVGTMLLYTLIRLGTLSELSVDVLLLLGISAAGTAGTKATTRVVQRLSFANWAWLTNKEWVTETVVAPTWGQLFTTDGEFDVTKFQMLVFSVVVGAGLVSSGIEGLATFDIPDSLLGILGLSQGVYIVGKGLVPPSVANYNQKLDTVVAAETAFGLKIAEEIKAGQPPPTDITTAKALAPKEFVTYDEEVRQASVMHSSIYGVKVAATKLEPRYPTV